MRETIWLKPTVIIRHTQKPFRFRFDPVWQDLSDGGGWASDCRKQISIEAVIQHSAELDNYVNLCSDSHPDQSSCLGSCCSEEEHDMGMVIRSWWRPVWEMSSSWVLQSAAGAAEPRLQMTAGHSRWRYLYPPAQLLTNDENDDGCKDEDCWSIDIFTLAAVLRIPRGYCCTTNSRGGEGNDNDDVINSASRGSCRFLIWWLV